MHETSAIVDDDGHEKRTFFSLRKQFFYLSEWDE